MTKIKVIKIICLYFSIFYEPNLSVAHVNFEAITFIFFRIYIVQYFLLRYLSNLR